MASKRRRMDTSEPMPEYVIDMSDVVTDPLEKDELYRIVVNEPAVLSKLITGVSNMVKGSGYVQIWGGDGKGTIGIDCSDGVAVIGMRMTGLGVYLSDDITPDERTRLFFNVDMTRFAQCLKSINSYDKLIIRKFQRSNTVELLSYEDISIGEQMSSEISDDTSQAAINEFDPKMVCDDGYVWHITDLDVMTLKTFVTRASEWKSEMIHIQIFKNGSEYTFCLFTKCPSDGTSTKITNRMTREEFKNDSGEEQVVWKVRKSTSSALAASKLEEVPVYSRGFTTKYLFLFLKASENSSVLALHLTADVEGEDPRPLILQYSIGSVETNVTYLKFAIAPCRETRD